MNDPLSYNRVNPFHRPSLCKEMLLLIWPAQPLPEQSRATAQKVADLRSGPCLFLFCSHRRKSILSRHHFKKDGYKVYVRLIGADRGSIHVVSASAGTDDTGHDPTCRPEPNP